MQDLKPISCLIGLGANLGVREENLSSAWRLIGLLPKTKTMLLSAFYETAAVGGPTNQPLFLNAAGLIETSLTAFELLVCLNRIENDLHRKRMVHWGPRTIDLDILLFGDEIIESANLTIPHPLMQTRRFVLEPACEIVPGMIHPGLGLTIEQLYNRLASNLTSCGNNSR
ncbi:MAG: 2-amino-4-hydroxy-6-hydroxymethyldihydropteridine diphosphokinase [Thermoguttaceae bacterium]|nr:2-amino-4-hydroxy-6-hydroxymethyldihydropteridine diphosphokinase [Thermoguttaceae bacterium]